MHAHLVYAVFYVRRYSQGFFVVHWNHVAVLQLVALFRVKLLEGCRSRTYLEQACLQIEFLVPLKPRFIYTYALFGLLPQQYA